MRRLLSKGLLPKSLLPKSLLGQMLLSVAFGLLVAQTLSAVLIYRAQQERRETGLINSLAFQLVAEPRMEFRRASGETPSVQPTPGRFRMGVEHSETSPLRQNETRDTEREDTLRALLIERGITASELFVIKRLARDDAYSMRLMRDRPHWHRSGRWGENSDLIVAGLRREGSGQWSIVRVPVRGYGQRALISLILQTLVLYIVLVGGLAILLRRITRPLAALTSRVEQFAETRATEGQIEASGPEDMQRLIAAHNAMENRIAALIDEKDVMLGAIGHDLKTPLTALRVRIESVEDDNERARMAATIEDISRSLDDILSLARVGRPSDPLERTDLAALTASVVEEFEDMGEPVALGEIQRAALSMRATWLRRALRNLISNALRYGYRARVSVTRDGASAVVQVEDDGPGIPDDEIGAMQEPFVRGEGSRNRATGGAGLGLTLAKAIAEQHGGTLTLTNRVDDSGHKIGLVAELRLPL